MDAPQIAKLNKDTNARGILPQFAPRNVETKFNFLTMNVKTLILKIKMAALINAELRLGGNAKDLLQNVFLYVEMDSS